MGIRIVSDDEAGKLTGNVERMELKDFDFSAITAAFARFGVTLNDLDAAAVVVFVHGAAPAGNSDRKFRFDYLDRRIREKNSLSAFAYLTTGIPASLSRLTAVAESAVALQCPLIVMDTAPAAVLGATFDPVVAQRKQVLIANIGNFHTLAFRLGPRGIEGLFEHHTGEIDGPKLEKLLRAMADSSLKNEDVFNDMGHGALIYDQTPLRLGKDDFDVVVTGPRRAMFQANYEGTEAIARRRLSIVPYFAVPFGDMMLTGCFGLLAATADLLPEFAYQIRESMDVSSGGIHSKAPWDVE